MRLSDKDKALLQDIRRFALEAKGFTAKVSEAAYAKDVVLQRASERSLEIIGEAARGLSQEALKAYLEVPFRDIVAMRHLLAHGYNKIDPLEVWKTLKKSVPSLLQALDKGPDIS
jgi:uncharacterized protein with HEPN domain